MKPYSFRKTIVITAISAALVGTGGPLAVAVAQAPIVEIPAVGSATTAVGLKVAIPALPNPLAVWLGKLEEAESRNSGDSHLKILDLNGRYSYGCLQFQEATFLAYGKRYGLVPQDLAVAEPLIYSCDLQKSIASRMILNDYRNWRQWYNSVKNVVGLPPKEEGTVAAK